MAETYPIIQLVLDGTKVEFSGSDILECNLLLELNPISATLPVSTASVSIFTTDPRFSIFSDGTFYNALSKHLPVDVLINFDGLMLAWYFYLDSWKMESENILSFELVDAMGVYASANYPGSFWETNTDVRTVLADISKFVNIEAFVPPFIEATVTGWIPPSNCRDALQQVCFAAGLQYSPGYGRGMLLGQQQLPEASSSPSFEITDDDKTGDQTVKLLPKITDIELISHDYYNLGAEAQTVEEIYSAWLEPGNYVISYPKPYWKVWGEGAGAFPIYVTTEDGRVIVTEDSVGVWGDATVRVATEMETFLFGSNFVSVNVTVAGQITLWGYPWLSADRPHRHHEIADTSNAITVENAMLVNSENASDVLNKIVEYYNLRHQTHVTVFPMFIALGNTYKVSSFRGKELSTIPERLEIDLAGGYITKATFRGMEYIPE